MKLQQGGEHLEGTWNTMRVDWACQDGEVSGSARDIRSRAALVVKICLASTSAKFDRPCGMMQCLAVAPATLTAVSALACFPFPDNMEAMCFQVPMTSIGLC